MNIKGTYWVSKSDGKKPVYFRIEETKIFDIQFLHDCTNPTIAILHEDTHGR